MTDKTVWFGTRERMDWIPAPASAPGVGRSLTKWRTGGQYINGGQWRKESASGARACSLQWPVMSASKVQRISALLEGSYGTGPFYYSDPFAEGHNSAPQWLAAPWLASEGAPRLYQTKPARVNTPANTYDYPSYGAEYTVAGVGTKKVLLPVPEGMTAHIGVHGAASGGQFRINGVAQTLLGVTTNVLTNSTVAGPSFLELDLAGTGTITLYGVVIRVLPTGVSAPVGPWVKGEGYAGLRLDGDPQITGYSSARDRQAITADFMETSPWE